MKKYKTQNSTVGYIEGYYGKLLTWENRHLIIKALQKNKMNTYFYAPKEDTNHRLNWRKKYSAKWRTHFREFTNLSKKNNINVIAGIAPGLDFNFKKFNNCINQSKNADFRILYEKARQLIFDGASSIALLLDDIPDDYKNKFGDKISEGTSHGVLVNTLTESLGKDIYFVPRIYADELIEDEPYYLKDLASILNPKTKVFYCGKNVVSKKLMIFSKINRILSNELIFWDNYYANDYCPRRFFIGPSIGREKLKNIMINPTGLIHTDLLIIDIFASCVKHKLSTNEWLTILKHHNVPEVFNKVKQFFLKPNFGSNPLPNSFDLNSKYFEALDFLLWKWKGELSREWYPYLFGLKQDLQLQKNILTSDRLVKTQTAPLSKYLNKDLLKGKL